MARSRTVSGGRRRTATGISTAALLLAVIGVLVLASAGFGYRFGWWGVRPAFTILRVSVYAAIVVAAVGVIAAIASLVARHRVATAGAILAVLLAAGTAAVPLAMQRTAQSVPHIHDITTDTDNPPTFVALRAVRERAPNGVDYGGPAVAAEQRAGYPDLAPLMLRVPPDRAFALAETTAKGLGWQIASAVPAEGRLEATDTTRWFHFKDDIVVRVGAAPDGSRVDVRSVSRIGRSDLGANARRIRAFLSALADRARA
jgi:uncharacterized protein (DUF1499 family)